MAGSGSGPLKVHVSPPLGVTIGNFMNEIRVWLDSQKIQLAAFRTTASDVGFGFEIDFHREEDAERFRERFSPA
jgi:hypothetical protein